MQRYARIAATMAALALVLASCGTQKATGLPAGPTVEPDTTPKVEVVDSKFVPESISIKQKESVKWLWVGSAPHNVKFTELDINSHPDCTSAGVGCSAQNETPFVVAFDFPAGEYFYYCVVHGTPDGLGMVGTVTVQ